MRSARGESCIIVSFYHAPHVCSKDKSKPQTAHNPRIGIVMLSSMRESSDLFAVQNSINFYKYQRPTKIENQSKTYSRRLDSFENLKGPVNFWGSNSSVTKSTLVW
jgi:hypothetical protein